MINVDRGMRFEEVELDIIRREIETVFPRELLDRMIWHMGSDRHNFKDVILHVKDEVYGEKKIEHITVQTERYTSWWQHFKAQCFPVFLLKKFPAKKGVESKEVPIERAFVFPDMYRHNVRGLNRYVIQDLNMPSPIFKCSK